MTKSNPGILTFEQFRDIIAKELMVAKEKVVPQASFIEDLLVDSIRMVEMMLKLEEMGMEIPLEAAWSIETVGDAYEQYAKHAQDSATSAGPVAATARGE
ncbi:MAG: acyl carrier protein [Chloroflexi bacterium]|nr:acyl carrier protein [Chloroflexota bacterium]